MPIKTNHWPRRGSRRTVRSPPRRVERLEREREGGGAPSARAGRRSGTLGARLCQSLLHPMHLPDIWRRVLPQAS